MRCEFTVTGWDGKKPVFSSEIVESAVDVNQENFAVNLHPDFRYQRFAGFGGAITEAAGLTYLQMPQALQQELLDAYYGADGLGYVLARMSIDSCDFSADNYSAMIEDGDVDGDGFSLARDEKSILPLYRAASEALGMPLESMLTPWSPPAFMKTNGEKNHGGKLKPEYRRKWAEYLCRYIEEYRARGVDVARISIQNEPAAVQTWDSCIYSAEEEKAFLRDYLYPEMQRRGLTDVEVYIWDHNKERALERAIGAIDDVTAPMIAGMAIHWYSGDHFDALRMVKERFPKFRLLFSEACIEYSLGGGDDHLNNARHYAHDLIGNLNAGVELFHDWNILLDETGGPNHVNNFCDAPLMYNRKTQTLEKRLSYYYLGHFSKAIVPGSVRIGSSVYSTEVDATAFLRPDGKLAVVLLNRTEKPKKLWLRVQGQLLPVTLPGDAIATALIDGLDETA